MKLEKLVSVKNLKKYFPLKKSMFQKTKKFVHAVDNITFDIYKGQTVGLVGESGCGKSTIAKTLMRLVEPTDGEVFFGSKDIFKLNGQELRNLRKDMSIILQDPYSSLDSHLRVLDIIAEPLKTHEALSNKEVRKRVTELLKQVGLHEEHLFRFPHEFSGGQRQRIAIARAIALNPSFVILDEPTSALDVSVQAQILNLLVDLKKKSNIGYLMISHNLSVVKYISDYIIIMYLGEIVESGKTEQVFLNPKHPYTKALMSSILDVDPDKNNEEIILGGEIPSSIDVPIGCNFYFRCMHQKKDEYCLKNKPVLEKYNNEEHFVACFKE